MRKGILVVIIGIIISAMMPFSIAAETIQSHVIGINVWTDRIESESITVSNTQYWRNTCNVHITFELDGDYLGWSNLGVSVQYRNYYYGAQNPYWGSTSSSWSGNVYINGSSYEIIIPIQFYSNSNAYYQGGGTYHLPESSSDITVTYTNQGNVSEFGELNTLNDIYNLLLDIQQNVSDSENLLNDISNIRNWSFPVESFGFNYYLLQHYQPNSIYGMNFYTYPIFNFSNGDVIFNLYVPSNQYATVIFIFDWNINNQSKFDQFFSVAGASSYTFNSTYPATDISGNPRLSIVTLKMFGQDANITLNYISNTKVNFIAIYSSRSDFPKNVSTDFALNWGLTNSVLDNLNIIAQGTSQSNSSASGLEQNNNQMASDMNSLATIESGYNQDFNSQMQNIDFSNPITNNQGLLPAANFVITVFNGLINNNPLSVLIIVCCILLIGKKVIGK